MEVTELKWLMDNRDLLDSEDCEALSSFDVFEQYNNGELRQNAIRMVELLGLVNYLYQKYNNL